MIETMTALPSSVLIRDVSLRDGLQDEAPISTEAKIAIAEALVAAGVRDSNSRASCGPIAFRRWPTPRR